MHFVDVIVPLSVPNYFTYSVPEELFKDVEVGKRVVVQFGKSRFYTALVNSIHTNAPEQYAAKDIQAVVDAKAIVTNAQLKLWKWMSTYYQCHVGEVMNAALPSGYKLVSESVIVLTDKTIDFNSLSDNEYLLAEALQLQGFLSIAEITKILGGGKAHPVVKTLLEKGVVELQEEITEKYKPLMKDYLQLNDIEDEPGLLSVFETLKNAPKQEDVLTCYTGQQGFNFHGFELEKLSFIKKNGLSTSAVKSLIDKGVFKVQKKEVGRIKEQEGDEYNYSLSEEQQQAKQKIELGFDNNQVVLLNGVTGSGKTEVYLSLIEKTLLEGKQVLYLLPEIALTTQLITRLKKLFGNKVGIYHSRYSQEERMEVWSDLLSDQPRFEIVIGARSSVFLPFTKLGLVIVDEEHESSFKQFDPAPRYHGRDVGIYLSKLHHASCLLGTATPSVESYFNVKNNKYAYAELKSRYGGTVLPEIQCADIQEDRRKKKMTGIFSKLLKDEITLALENNEQVILFQNRRGFAPVLECNTCGNTEKCSRCDVTLTYHKLANQLRCHYCGSVHEVQLNCSSCGSIETGFKGFGTEMIEEEIKTVFPLAKVIRMDHDTTRGKYSYQKILNSFADKEVDILVGTQMVTKGLDFGNVSLVGVLNADQMLNFPDFRAFERAYQLLTQVSGRAGRRKKRGKVIIQTYTPYHAVIRNVMDNDYKELYNTEILDRRNFNYPPFYKLINITLKHRNKSLLDGCAEGFSVALKGELTENRVLGPEYPAISKINKFYQKNILIKFEKEASAQTVKNIIRKWVDTYKKDKSFQSVRFVIDVDPQ